MVILKSDNKMENKKKSMKRSNISQLIFSLVIIILINVIGYFAFIRVDLTTENRYSLSPTTKTLLKSLDDIVYFKIYLEGDFPAGFKRLHNETKEMLDEFRAYNKNIQYEFYDPNTITNKKEQKDFYKQLVQKGLQPTNLQVKDKGATKQQIIFPCAEVTYKNKTMTLELLNSQLGLESESVINNSIQALEYNISNVIRKLSVRYKPKVAIIQGHGELRKIDMYDITTALNEYYQVEWIHLKDTFNGRYAENINCLTEHPTSDTAKTKIQNKYKAIIIAKPDSVFSDREKFIIDQFIMRGGKVLWMIDPVFTSMDSLKESNHTVAVTNELNLADQLFKYGVRLNTNLIMDLNCLPIPTVVGKVGNQPQIKFMPWYYFPVLMPTAKHPIVNNLNAIKTEFISSLDTIENPVKKTILITTSNYSRVLNAPVIIDLDIQKKKPDTRLYNKPNLPVAVLLEGIFESNYAHRMTPEIMESKEIGFIDMSVPTSMIVVSDGDIIRNQLHYSKGYPLPLGYDQFTKQTFGNKEFILNCMNYLTDGSGLIAVRSRELKLRLLDKTAIDDSRLQWQLINVLVPVILILLFGIIQAYLRKRKYTK